LEKQVVIDRITETENLTDNLEDDDANWLIDWGINKASELIAPISDGEVAGGKLNAVMAVMRKLNQIVGSHASKEAGALSDDVRVLAMMYANAFGTARQLDATALKRAGKAIGQKTPHDIMEYLLNLIAPDSTNSHK
jgi:hypothetical protein